MTRIIDPTVATPYKTYDVTVTAGDIKLATRDGEAMFFHTTKNFSGLAGKKITFIDSAGKRAVAYGYQNGGGKSYEQDGASDKQYVVNGGFDIDATWTKGTNWTIGAGVAANSGGVVNQWLFQTVAATIGSLYDYSFDAISISAGSYTIVDGNFQLSTTITSTGSHVFTHCAGGTAFGFAPNLNFVGSVDNAGMKKIINVPTTGMLLSSTRTGSTRNMAEPPETGFNPNRVVTVRVENAPVIIDPTKPGTILG
jgi:hypothetical protein